MPVICAIDYTGRAVLGTVNECNYPDDVPAVLDFEDPVYLLEIPNGQIVDLKLKPILHTFDIKSIKVKWTSVFPVDDKLIKAYNDILQQHRAARAGILIPIQAKPRAG